VTNHLILVPQHRPLAVGGRAAADQLQHLTFCSCQLCFLPGAAVRGMHADAHLRLWLRTCRCICCNAEPMWGAASSGSQASLAHMSPERVQHIRPTWAWACSAAAVLSRGSSVIQPFRGLDLGWEV